jgi:hypothetical protein
LLVVTSIKSKQSIHLQSLLHHLLQQAKRNRSIATTTTTTMTTMSCRP